MKNRNYFETILIRKDKRDVRINFYNSRIKLISLMVESFFISRPPMNGQFYFKLVNQNHYYIVKGNLHKEYWTSNRMTTIGFLLRYPALDEMFKVLRVKKL